jgi:trehalose 6-phosphate synthase
MNAAGGLESEEWLELVTHRPLGILTDLDGTLLPFAATPDEARPSPNLLHLIEELSALPGVTLAIVSGRPRVWFEHTLPATSALIVAEHGAWRRGRGGWEALISLDPQAIDSLAAELGRVVESYPGALLERKTWALALHYRNVSERDKMGLLVQATAVVDPWLSANRDFDDLAGTEVLEVRPRAARKDNAVAWMRSQLGPEARLIAVGDDVTDEDMFAATTARDAAILVGDSGGRPTSAGWRLESTDDAIAFYRWIVALRREQRLPGEDRAHRPSRVPTLPDVTGGHGSYELLVLSNRLPELRSSTGEARKRNVGGLVSALGPALVARKGIWLGWSGRTRPDAAGDELGFERTSDLSLAWMDFPDEWQVHYYNGLSNSALWPLFHSFPERVRLSHTDWTCYERANAAFANAAAKLVGPDATVWVHDYHLLLVGQLLRERGHRGPVGFFQHIPFPAPDLFFVLPWARQILEAMASFDLVGFHTAGHVENFLACAARAGLHVEGETVSKGDRRARVARFPLGIIPGDFEATGAPSEEIAGMLRSMGGRKIVLGVDRLDYTKGIPERVAAFGSMLQQFPELRRRVCMVQVSVPSRADVPDYADQRSRVENIVGRINGEYGEADWVPVRYLYRSYGRSELTELYRVADVGYVTPLRDGMNLVAKEYVAAQDGANPGVLLLSRFAGAAEELRDAVLTNPWDAEGTARELARALEMPLIERRARHARLMAVVSQTTAVTWAESFLGALAAAHGDAERAPGSLRRVANGWE